MSYELPLPALVLLPFGGVVAWVVVRHAWAAIRSRGDAYEVGVAALAVIALAIIAGRVVQLSAFDPSRALLGVRIQYTGLFVVAACAAVARGAASGRRWYLLAAAVCLAFVPLLFSTHAFAGGWTAPRVGAFGNRYYAVGNGPLGYAFAPIGGVLAFVWLRAVHVGRAWSRWSPRVWAAIAAVTALVVVHELLSNRGLIHSVHLLEYAVGALVLGLSHLTERKAQRDILALEEVVSTRTHELRAQQAALERALERLRTGEARYRQLADMALEGIVVHREGRIVDVNAAMCRLGGYEADELRGRDLEVLFAPGEAKRLRPRISFGALEAVARRRDGSTFPVEVAARTHGDQGVVVLRDVSERRELQARLALADRMVSLGTLAAGVAHEVNNPLTYVLTNVEFALAELEAGHAGAEVQRALGEARDGCHRVRRIVSELRRISRTDEPAPGPVDLHRVIEAAIQMASNEIRHRARLVREYGELPAVLGDESKLAQVVVNLLLNAAQAMPVGRVDSMVLRVRTSRDERGRAVLEVADTGHGIPQKLLARIFDPFFTTKPVGHGTGLGLAICQSIVSAAGGEIRVESTVGRGTTFRVALPVTEDTPSSESLPRLRPAAPVARARVLVVDDEPAVVRAVARILRDHDVKVTTRAADALELCRSQPFDVIVSDLMMPEMSGMEFHARLSAEAPELARRMTFMTGGAFAASAQEFLARLEAPHITKPFDAARLHEAIDAVLRRALDQPQSGGR